MNSVVSKIVVYSLFLQFLNTETACQVNESKGWERGGLYPFIPWSLWYSCQENKLKWGLLSCGHLPTGSGVAHQYVPCKSPENHHMAMTSSHQGLVQIWSCNPEVKGFLTQLSPRLTSFWPFHSQKIITLLIQYWFYAPDSGITSSPVFVAPSMPSAQI